MEICLHAFSLTIFVIREWLWICHGASHSRFLCLAVPTISII